MRFAAGGFRTDLPEDRPPPRRRPGGRGPALPGHRVLTDVTGGFNRVILEYEVDSYTGLYLTGHRELLQTV